MEPNEQNHTIVNDDIHGYQKRLASIARNIEDRVDSKIALAFLNKLRLSGKAEGRIYYYAERIPELLKLLEKHGIKLRKATKQDCEQIVSEIISRNYKGETKKAYALTLQRLVNFAKTGEIGDRESGYVREVGWIRPSKYVRGNESEIKPEDLLTADDLYKILEATTSRRDRAMLWVMFEGAFRPGELLHMKVGGVEFRDRYLLVSTYGKTGSKRVALVLSYKPLLEWLQDHPERENPISPLWYSLCRSNTGKRISYGYLRELVKKCAEKAGIRKRVWNYLFRHSQLTILAKKLSDQTLRVYGNWKPGSKMAARYVHLSGKDVEDAILELHGLKDIENERSIPKLKECPRCSEQNTPEVKRCVKCGLILDQGLAARLNIREQNLLGNMLHRIEKIENEVSGWLRTSKD